MREEYDEEKVATVVTIAWSIWANRNEVRHGGTKKTAEALVKWSAQYLAEYRSANTSTEPVRRSQEVAFDRLASRDFRDFLKGRKDIDGSLKKLKMLLRSANVVLVDAEDNQYTNPDVKEWLDDLQDAVYDADDLLDEIALRCKLQAESQTGTSEVWNFITAFVDSFDKEIPFKLEKILADLDSIIDQMGILCLKKDIVGVKLSSLPSQTKTSCLETCDVIGRDMDKEEIFKLWQSDVASKICVVPIVGMGGIGKTTLAQFVFNDEKVKKSFDLKAWVCVSENFDNLEILKAISEGINEESNESNEITKETRHLSYYKAGFYVSKEFEIPSEAKGLRTLLVKSHLPTWIFEYKNIVKIDLNLFQNFKCLRVLSLYGACIKELPITVDNLIHLRYLNICNTGIKDLPDSLCNLYNLQTLILSSYITKLPANTSKLFNLRHLDNSEANMEEMPPHMGKMKNLRKLYVFYVSKHDDGSNIKELGELQHLSGKLSLLNLENVQCIDKDTKEVILKNKQDLSELKLEWEHGHGIKDSEKEIILLEQLCPCTNLNSLTITNYKGTSFPKWLGDSSFSKMVFIKLRNCFSLPPLGQLPGLKSLIIECFREISSVGPEFYGNTINPFRALEYLSFENMPEWQEWVLFNGEVFTCLRELYIKDCPKLSGGLPVQLPSLTKLNIRKCKQLVASLPNSPALHELRGLCAPNLSHIIIHDCRNLVSLPEGMHTLLPSLVRLELRWCPELESFPEKLISRRMELGLQGLHSLRSFTISDHRKELESFPEEALLPPNLTDFAIGILPYLKSLNGKGFQPLTSLKHLTIWDCNNLDGLLEDVLPTSLYQLEIYNCRLLKERYGNEKGEGRVKIAHIPRISIR
nr:putative disease resistance rpp13-like protein 1 [Quercus suber]